MSQKHKLDKLIFAGPIYGRHQVFLKSAGKSQRDDQGFTLLEVIAVLVIMGIVAAVMASRITGTNDYSLAAEAETLKAHLRYAQYRAMSETVPFGISFEAGCYNLRKNRVISTSTLPNESSPTHILPAETAIATGRGTTIDFNEWGNPTDGAGNLLTADTQIVLSGRSSTKAIIIKQNTGFIP